MSKEQGVGQRRAVPGVAVTIPNVYHWLPTSTYTDARCRLTFSTTARNQQYPRTFRLTNTGANNVWFMFNSSRATAPVAATVKVNTTTNGVTLAYSGVLARTYGGTLKVVLIDPGTASITLAVTFATPLITVRLATDASGTITTTPNLLQTAITAAAILSGAITATTSPGTSALVAQATTTFTAGVDKDSATARKTAISGQAAANTLTAKQAFLVAKSSSMSFCLGDDVEDLLVYAETTTQGRIMVEAAYESETIL